MTSILWDGRQAFPGLSDAGRRPDRELRPMTEEEAAAYERGFEDGRGTSIPNEDSLAYTAGYSDGRTA